MLKNQSDVNGMMSVKVMSLMSKMSEDIDIQFKRIAKYECLDLRKITFKKK
jgi:aryl carrier-like protein